MTSVRQMWTSAKIDEVPNSIDTSKAIVRYFRIDKVRLKSVVAEQIQSFLLGEFKSLEAVLGLDYLLYKCLQSLEVRGA